MNKVASESKREPKRQSVRLDEDQMEILAELIVERLRSS